MGRRIASLATMAVIVAILVPAGASTDRAEADAAPVKPNVVLILSDDQGPGLEAGLPYLSSQPFGDWTTFSRAYLNNPLCCPSRATIFSGQYSHRTGVESNSSGQNFNDSASIATWLKAAGYRTALLGKYLNGYPFGRPFYVPPGWTDWAVSDAGGDYYDYNLFDGQSTKRYGSSAADYSTDVIAGRASDFLRTTSEPFFAELSLHAPHDPFTPAPRYETALANVSIPRRPNFNEADVSDKPASIRSLGKLTTQQENKRIEDKRTSMRSLLAVDDAVKKVVDTLNERGILEDTIIIFMTDNGYTLGEHRLVGKRCQYEECVGTPLMVRVPGQGTRTDSHLVGNVDLASTFAELAGTTPTISQDGRSLVPLLYGTDDSNWRTGYLIHSTETDAGVVPFWGVVTERYKYVELSTGEKELYDLAADPFELSNRSSDAPFANLQSELAAQLAALRGQAPPPPPPPPPPPGSGPAFGSASTASAAAARSLTVPAPEGLAPGELMLAVVRQAATTATVTAPAGWSFIRQDGSKARASLYYKVASTSEAASYTFATSATADLEGHVLRYSGVSSTSPIMKHAVGTSSVDTGSSLKAPSLTPTVSGSLYVPIWTARGTGLSVTPPSSVVERTDTSTRATVATGDRALTGTAATGEHKGVLSRTSDRRIGQAVLLRPA